MASSIPENFSTLDFQWNQGAWNMSHYPVAAQVEFRYLIKLHNNQVKDLRRQIRDAPASVKGLEMDIKEKDAKIREMKDADRRRLEMISNLEKKLKKKDGEVADLRKGLKGKDEKISNLHKKHDQIIQTAANDVKALKKQFLDLPATPVRKVDPTNNSHTSPDTKIALSIAETEIERLAAQVSRLQEEIAELTLDPTNATGDAKPYFPGPTKAGKSVEGMLATEVAALGDKISVLHVEQKEQKERHLAAITALQQQRDEGEKELNDRITQLRTELVESIEERDEAFRHGKRAYEQLSGAKERIVAMQTRIDILEQEKASGTARESGKNLTLDGTTKFPCDCFASCYAGMEDLTLDGSVKPTPTIPHPKEVDLKDPHRPMQGEGPACLLELESGTRQDDSRYIFEDPGGFEVKVNLPKGVAADFQEVEQPLLDLDVDEGEACGWPVLAADNHTHATLHDYESAVVRVEPSNGGDQHSFQNGLAVGVYRGRIEGRMAGHQAGVEEGFVDGFERGRVEGYKAGREEGIRQERLRRAEATRSAHADMETTSIEDGFTRGVAQALQSSTEETQKRLNVVMQEMDAKRITEV